MGVESVDRGRRKKLIRALESSELHGRPTCSECTERMKHVRGCKKPGHDYKMQGAPFTYSSPALQGEADRVMYECPTGYTLREAPHTFDVIESASLAENAGPDDIGRMSSYWHRAARVVASERIRLREAREHQRKAQGDASAVASAVRRRLRG